MLNYILKSMDKNEIEDPLNFIDIDRRYIVDGKILELLFKEEDTILKLYKKTDVKWRKKDSPNYMLCFLKNTCMDLGYILKYKPKISYNKGIVKNTTVYRIEKVN